MPPQPSRSDDLKIARERSFGQVGAVGAADHVSIASNRGSDEVYVVGVKLSREQPQLLGQTIEQVLACASGQLVDDLADGPVVERRLRRQRPPDRRRLDVFRVEQRREVIEERVDQLHVVADTAQTVEGVADKLHPGDIGREALEECAVRGELSSLKL